uniref:Myosin motor domain-containing protein n=1 Tax=Ditylenchus dipsaci TaxID=166011 RepID=A0A915E3Y0_9BILA
MKYCPAEIDEKHGTLCSSSALAKVIYERLFGWIVGKCNSAIERESKDGKSNNNSDHKFIGVLDMAGFEIMSRNSFEQFCINFTNEKLQQFFNQFMFIKEKAEYLNEGIEWNEVDYGNDLQHTIDMIERPMGFLSLLQEECIVPNGSDISLLDKLVHNLSNANGGVFAKAKLSNRNTSVNHFTVSHYAGQVAYNIDGWLEKNRDLVDQSLMDVLAGSEHALVSKLFPQSVQAPQEMVRSRRGSLTTSTVSCIYKEQLSNLLQTLNSTTAQFIRCIVPNYARQPFVLDGPLVLHQLRCNGVLEGIRICRRGYPNRLAFGDFFNRYKILASNIAANLTSPPSASTLNQLCASLHIQEDRYKVGRTKVFCKVGLVSELEARRKEHISRSITGLQAWIRWHIQQRIAANKHLEWEKTMILQTAVRQHIQMAGWEWYRLHMRVRQLIPMVLDKRKLKQLEQDNYELNKNNKLMTSQLESMEESRKVINQRMQELEEDREEEHQRVVELRQELKRNEDLLELMEKKFDDQHAKIMRLNGTLKDNSKALEKLEEEKQIMQTELDTTQKKLKAEQEACQEAQESLKLTANECHHLHVKLDTVYQDNKRLDERLQHSEEQVAEAKEKLQAQEEANSTLQHNIADLNDKINKCENALHDERAARRRCENELDQQDEEVARLKDELEKGNAKREAMKEQLRVKENTIRKLERKLEDKTAEMDDCIGELKKIHKASQQQLQTQLEELRRKIMKLEMENKQQKCKLESSFERESSVDSDFGRTTSLSRYGSRHSINGGGASVMTSSSISSSSMGRTLGSRRRETEPELLGLRGYDPFASSSTLGGGAGQMTSSLTNTFDSGLARSSSSSSSNQMVQLQASERRVSQLERELQSVKTDGQLVKREVEVYKAALQEAERAKDTLTKQTRGLSSEVERLTKSIETSDQKLQQNEFDNRKWVNECEVWKQRLENSIADSKNELMAEKKKHAEKLDEQKHDYELKIHHISNSQKSHDQLQEKLTEAELQLDKAIGQLAQMERMNKSNATIGETWESQYRQSLQEVESLRDENASLKSKIRRQYKQIELLTRNFYLI